MLRILSFLFACFLLACAAELPPHPPQVQIPETVKDLSVNQVGNAWVVSFTRPRKAVDGRRLTKPVEARLFRLASGSGGPAPKILPSTRPWVTFEPEELAALARSNKVVDHIPLSAQDFSAELGETLTFAVETLTRGFRGRPRVSPPSNLVSRRLLDVPDPASQVRVIPTEKALEVEWAAPSSNVSGHQTLRPMAYRVYRSDSGKPSSFLLRGEADSSPYFDSDFQFGHHYFYRVRAVVREGGAEAESDDSAVATITPRDTFPPQPPRGLRALSTGTASELVWNPNSETDLAGYNVYRRKGDGAPERLNHQLVQTPVFSDSSAKGASGYTYWVTAVDLAGNESQPSAPVEVRAE